MKLIHLSIASIILCVIGLLAMLLVTVASATRLQQQQDAIADLLHLKERIDIISVGSDDIVVNGADAGLWRAFVEDARDVRRELLVYEDQYPESRKAAHRIDIIIDELESILKGNVGQSWDPEPATGVVGPMSLNPRVSTAITKIAMHGVALDTALDYVLTERQQQIAKTGTRIIATLAVSSLLFGMLCILAFILIHHRLTVPARALLHTIHQHTKGETDARTTVTGNDEMAQMAASFNNMLDQRETLLKELRAKQADLEEKEALLAESQRIARLGSWRLDLCTDELQWSEETYRIVGVSPDSFIPSQEAFFACVHPDDLQKLHSVRTPALKGEQPHDVTFRIIRPNGEIRYVHERAMAKFDEKGNALAFAGSIQDITERKQLDARLLQFSQLVESNTDMCGVCDEHYQLRYVNAAYCDYLGKPRDAIEGHHLAEVLGNKLFTEDIEPHLQKAFQGESIYYEMTREHAAHGARNVLVKYFPISSSDHNNHPYVGAIISDITDLKRAQDKLNEQAQLLDIAARVAKLGGWSIDLATDKVFWSDEVAEIHGMPHGYSPTVDEAINFYTNHDRDRIRSLFTRCVEEGVGYDDVLEIKDANGKQHWVRTTAEAFHDDNGKVIKVQGGFQDVTERKQLDARLLQFSQLVESSTDMCVIYDEQYRLLYVNAAYCAYAGQDRDTIEGHHVPETLGDQLFTEDIEPHLQKAFQGESISYEMTREHPIHGTRTVLVKYFPVSHNDHEKFHYVGAIITDITDLKRAQDKLQGMLKTRQALINSLPAHIALLNHEGTIVDVNDQWRHFGEQNKYAGNDNFGVGTNYINLCEASKGDCADEATEVASGLRSVLTGKKQSFALEYPCHAPGEERWFRVMANQITNKDDKKRSVGAVIMHVDVTERKQAELMLSKLANEDTLTGLLSRYGFAQTLSQYLEKNGWEDKGMLLHLDIANMHDINQAHGYSTGDQLFVEIGKRLQTATSAEAIIGRPGSDEFIIYVPGAAVISEDMICEQIDAAFAAPFVISDVSSIEIRCRIGYTVLDRQQRDIETLLREAELALFQCRYEGTGDHWSRYTHELGNASRQRMTITRELHEALRNNEFELHFQPKVKLENGNVVACEALIRWQHPEHGMLSPGVFIPIAEQSQLIRPLGEWVMNEACRLLREWMDEGLDLVRVSINVSMVQFVDESFVDKVSAALLNHNISPENLTLEITESVFENHTNILRSKLEQLQQMGLRTSLDDFGTGYSSLRYLQQFHFNEIKIDQSFVRKMLEENYSHRIVETIIGIANALDAEVVAEGIEQAEVAEALAHLGCRIGQGYYYSPPMAAEDFRWLLISHERLPSSAGKRH